MVLQASAPISVTTAVLHALMLSVSSTISAAKAGACRRGRKNKTEHTHRTQTHVFYLLLHERSEEKRLRSQNWANVAKQQVRVSALMRLAHLWESVASAFLRPLPTLRYCVNMHKHGVLLDMQKWLWEAEPHLIGVLRVDDVLQVDLQPAHFRCDCEIRKHQQWVSWHEMGNLGDLIVTLPAHEVILQVHVLIKHLHVKLLAGQLGENHLMDSPSYKSI